MANINLSWFVKEPDNTYNAYTEYYAGTCNSNSDFIIDVDLWNNRWNTKEDIDDATNTKLTISFENVEDSIMLQLCTVSINGGTFEVPNISTLNKGIVDLGTISGAKNNGNDNNSYNHKKIIIKFSNIPSNLKDGLKSMFLNVQFDE
jgi:hypothetical protein